MIDQAVTEIADTFPVEDSCLVSILHLPKNSKFVGVLIVVGGPQTRVGSHRQFLLLARFLADKGFPVMRFDYRGMGDSDGEIADFETSQADILAAIEHFFENVEGLQEIVIWGLCDAASAALMFAAHDPRVSNMLLLNPWVRSADGQARTYLKHYYLDRLRDRKFWTKLFSGDIKLFKAGLSFFSLLGTALKRPARQARHAEANIPFQEQMKNGFKIFSGKILIILSGNNDYVAQEFRDLVKSSPEWRKLANRSNVSLVDIPEANHTFARHDWRSHVENLTYEFLVSLPKTK